LKNVGKIAVKLRKINLNNSRINSCKTEKNIFEYEYVFRETLGKIAG